MSQTETVKKTTKKREYLYPQRRYGIEVDRYEDVGTIVMRDGVLPVRVMTRDERNSVPEEIRTQRSFTYPIGFPDFAYDVARGFQPGPDDGVILTFTEEDYRKTCERMRQILALGFWVRYKTDDGTIYERHTDGKLYRVDVDVDKMKSTSVFLRMATPEDDALFHLRDESEEYFPFCDKAVAV